MLFESIKWTKATEKEMPTAKFQSPVEAPVTGDSWYPGTLGSLVTCLVVALVVQDVLS